MNELQDQVTTWLATGSIGSSSKLMALWLGFNKLPHDSFGPAHPHDPDDFDRCLQLLEVAPLLRPEMHRLSSVSPVWSALITHWDEIEKSHLDEVGLRWTKARKASKTYALMRKVIDSVAA